MQTTTAESFKSSGVHSESKSPSDLHRYTLESPEVKNTLILFQDLIASCRGHHGHIKMVQNCVGGHLTLTSTSCRLLSTMSFSSPVIRLIVNAAQGHLNNFQDGGHFLMLLCLNMILRSISIDANRKVIISLYEQFLDITVEYLNSSESAKIQCAVKVSDLNHMHSVVKTILRSKPLCNISVDELCHLSRILLEVFLQTLDDSQIKSYSDKILVITNEGKRSIESTVYPGLLIQCPEIPSFCKQDLNIKLCHGTICVALVTVSMSGDSEETGEIRYETDVKVDVGTAILSLLESFCTKLKDAGVGILICQKVVHPKLKRQLRKDGIFVMERTGKHIVSYIRDISGAIPFCHFHGVCKENFGILSSVQHVIVQDKSYLHLSTEKVCVMTLILYSPQEEWLEELKTLCTTVLITLRQLLHSPKVLLGGGCWQTYTAEVVRNKVQQTMSDIVKTMKCSQSTVESACEVFTYSLTSAVTQNQMTVDHMTDVNQSHIWRVAKGINQSDCIISCGCGSLQNKLSELEFLSIGTNTKKLSPDHFNKSGCGQEELQQILSGGTINVDLLSQNLSALKTAVITANTVLSIGQYIQDIN